MRKPDAPCRSVGSIQLNILGIAILLAKKKLMQ
jgi:hypothetical protein